MDKTRFEELARRLAVRSAELHAQRGNVPAEVRQEATSGVIEFPAIDASVRARKTRMVLKIADCYGWRLAITHFLDVKGVAYLSDLTDPQLDDLLDRMQGYVDAAETGCSLADSLPAY